MKVVIDCFKLVKGKGKSIGIYNVAINVARELAPLHDITVLGNDTNREDFDFPGINFICVPHNPGNKMFCIYWELILVSHYLKKIGADRVLFPRGFATLRLFKGKTEQIVTINDMIPFYYHQNYPGVLNKYENFYIMNRLKASARSSSHVLTISEASKKEIVRIAGISPDKVEVIYVGQSPMDTDGIHIEKSEQPYICAMCSALPHKNAMGVIKSYENYVKMAGESAYDLKIIGLKDVEEYNIDRDIKKRITCIKFLPKNEDMYGVMGGSRVFLFLSKIEGFGIPPLEAMQLGVPVVSSGAYSLSEVVGDAGILVDPDNYEEAAEALIKMHDENVRQKYIEKGYENIKRFSWSDIIKQYERVLFQ